jgi:hypothetical protein
LDALPVNFGSQLVPWITKDDGKDIDCDAFPRSEMNAAMQVLSVIIWKEGEFRFRHTGTNFQNFTYKYHCSQDLMHTKSYQSMVEEEKQRDGRRMARFPCESKLNIRPCLQNRTLSLSIHHKWHIPYEDIELSPIVQELIKSRGDAQESEFDSSESSSEQDEDEDENGENEDVPMEIQVAKFRKMMQDAMALFEDQVAKGNEKFVERFMASNEINRTFLEEGKHRYNKRNMPRTWGRCRHPATMYLN